MRELNDLDLEKVASGKASIKKFNDTLDSINGAARMIQDKGGLLLDNGNKILGPFLK